MPLPRIRSGLLLGLTLLLTSGYGPDQVSQYVCSIDWLMECASDRTCAPPSPEDPPTFINVDLDASRITLLAPASRRGEVSVIRVTERQEDRVILAGVEGNRGWSMIIAEPTGRMSLTLTDADAGWVVFGNCLAEGAVRP